MSWADDLEKLTKKGSKNLGILAKSIKIELFSNVVLDTRVDTGRLRGNWQIQESKVAQGESGRLDKSGLIVMSEIERKSTSSGKTYFTNNLPYAKKFETADAMVGRAVSRVRQIVKDEVRKLK